MENSKGNGTSKRRGEVEGYAQRFKKMCTGARGEETVDKDNSG